MDLPNRKINENIKIIDGTTNTETVIDRNVCRGLIKAAKSLNGP